MAQRRIFNLIFFFSEKIASKTEKKILSFQLHLWNTSEVAVERIWNGRKIPGFSSPHLTAWGGCSSSRSCDTERGFTRGATRKHLVLVWYYNSIFDFICETFELHGYNRVTKSDFQWRTELGFTEQHCSSTSMNQLSRVLAQNYRTMLGIS